MYRIALTRVPQIGCVQARTLIEKFGSARAVFQARTTQLEHTEGMGSRRAMEIKKFRDFGAIEPEINFIHRYQIRALCLQDPDYPRRLLNCYDPPIVLFVKGPADLNAPRLISIVGTRKPSPYGYEVTEMLIAGLASRGIGIISGLALGIDAFAHRMALKYQLPTMGILAHGLEHFYPPQNKSLARQMIQDGGALVTEFTSKEAPDKHHFPTRNRIVAGMSDATIVIESGIKGGSMVTASLANSYNREVFAIPGRTTDHKSSGCNLLVKQYKAQLLTDAPQLLDHMGWQQGSSAPAMTPEKLPFPLNEQEQLIVTALQTAPSLSIDDLQHCTRLAAGTLSATLLHLEMQGLVQSLPGKHYRCKLC